MNPEGHAGEVFAVHVGQIENVAPLHRGEANASALPVPAFTPNIPYAIDYIMRTSSLLMKKKNTSTSYTYWKFKPMPRRGA